MVFPLLAAALPATGGAATAAGAAAAASQAGMVLGGANIALGLGQTFLGYQAKQQQYRADKAFQDANSKFASWQAGFNAKVNDANSQYKFWQETVNYNQELAAVGQKRIVETSRAMAQAELVAETRAAAGAEFMQDSAALTDAYTEQEMAAAMAQKQYQWRALQARSSVRALGREGRSVDRLVNDYARQEGDYMAIEAINEGIRANAYTRAQQRELADYLSKWNSQQFYEEQVFMDPIAPFPPLPTLMAPAPPSRTGQPPSLAAALLSGATSVLSGVETGIDTTYKLNQLRIPQGKRGPGTGRSAAGSAANFMDIVRKSTG